MARTASFSVGKSAETGSEDAAAALQHLICGKMFTSALYAAADLGIADLLREGPRGVADLADTCRADKRSLERLMRLLVALEVFEEVSPAVYRLAAAGQYLRSDVKGSLRATALVGGSPWMWLPWGELLFSVCTGEAGFDRAFGQGLLPYLKEHPEEGEAFNEFMGVVTRDNADSVVAAYDFAGIRNLVDVGGGRGILISAILAANPDMNGTLFDQPQVVGQATDEMRRAGLAHRCDVVGGDFFEAVPGDGDGYFLSHVLHDWDDERCLMILRSIRTQIGEQGRLLVLESVVPEMRVPLQVALIDLGMAVMSEGGYERTEAEYRALFSKADFELERVIPTSSRQNVSVLEVRPV
ncbi:MAG: hypothetical protein QOH66_2491 [Actinomycetota bacterium]|nr:hypothetical protein [Actinomycetota bacterium]